MYEILTEFFNLNGKFLKHSIHNYLGRSSITGVQLFEVGAYSSDFCLWGWMKGEVYKENVNARDELVPRIMNSDALIKQERQDDLRRATRTIAKRVEMCIEVDGGIFEHLL